MRACVCGFVCVCDSEGGGGVMLAWKWKRRMMCLQGTSWCNSGIKEESGNMRIFSAND